MCCLLDKRTNKHVSISFSQNLCGLSIAVCVMLPTGSSSEELDQV